MGGTVVGPALKPRTASVVVFQGDDAEVAATLTRKVTIAKRQADEEAKAPSRIGDDKPAAAALAQAKAEYDEFVDTAADRAVVIELTALRRSRFRSLMAANRPREGNGDDEAYEVDMDAFPEPFLRESVTDISIGEESLPAGKHYDLIEDLAEGDFERVFASAYWLNRAPGADPRDGRYSSAPRSSDET